MSFVRLQGRTVSYVPIVASKIFIQNQAATLPTNITHLVCLPSPPPFHLQLLCAYIGIPDQYFWPLQAIGTVSFDTIMIYSVMILPINIITSYNTFPFSFPSTTLAKHFTNHQYFYPVGWRSTNTLGIRNFWISHLLSNHLYSTLNI